MWNTRCFTTGIGGGGWLVWGMGGRGGYIPSKGSDFNQGNWSGGGGGGGLKLVSVEN